MADVFDDADRPISAWQDRAAFGLIVERDVARHDGEVERLAGLGHAHDGAGELAHDLGLLRIAEIHVVGDGERLAPTAVMLRHASRRPGDRRSRDGPARSAACSPRSWRDPCGCRPRAPERRRRPAADRGVAHDQVVVLVPDPCLAGEVGELIRVSSEARQSFGAGTVAASITAGSGVKVHGRS